MIIVDSTGPSIEATLAPPPPGEFKGGEYILPGTPTRTPTSWPTMPAPWIRYTHGIMGGVNLDPEPAWTLYAGLRGVFIGSETTAFDSLWMDDGEQVLRAVTPGT